MNTPSQPQLPRLAFIGAGNIATAIIMGLIHRDYPRQKLAVADPVESQLEPFHAAGITTSQDNLAVLNSAEVVVLCVKPNMVPVIARSIAGQIEQTAPLVISVAAGVTLTSLASWLGSKTALVRCMPNTPALVQLGASGLYGNSRVTQQQRSWTETIMNAVGISLWLDTEAQLDAVTALSGSGPAYYFYIMEIMERVGAELGLAPDTSRTLVLQTALGAATMAHQSAESTAELKRRVTSPGGTTEAALNALQESDLAGIFEKAIKAAERRSVELSGSTD